MPHSVGVSVESTRGDPRTNAEVRPDDLEARLLRPAVAQERVTRGPDGLVRIALKKAFADGTVAVDLDPLSLLSRLAAAVPAPRFHTVRYAGVLASATSSARGSRPRARRGHVG